jgi:hypothetical protein
VLRKLQEADQESAKELKQRRESFSSFLIISDHKKIWSRAKTIFGTPSFPPPFPPFPPQSSVFQFPPSQGRDVIVTLREMDGLSLISGKDETATITYKNLRVRRG